MGDAKVALITDRTVAELHGRAVIDALEKAGVEPEVAIVPAGERHKTLRQAFELLDWLTGTQLSRRDVIVLLRRRGRDRHGRLGRELLHARRSAT